MTVRGEGAKGWLKLIGAVLAVLAPLVMLWITMAKPAVSEAARSEARTVTEAISKRLDAETQDRKEADARNDAQHELMQRRLDSRLEQIEKTQGDQTKLILELLRRTPR